MRGQKWLEPFSPHPLLLGVGLEFQRRGWPPSKQKKSEVETILIRTNPPLRIDWAYLSMPGRERDREFVRNSPTENFILDTLAVPRGGRAIRSMCATWQASHHEGTSVRTMVSVVKREEADLPLEVERSSDLITFPTTSSQKCSRWLDSRRSTRVCSCGRRDRWSDRFIVAKA